MHVGSGMVSNLLPRKMAIVRLVILLGRTLRQFFAQSSVRWLDFLPFYSEKVHSYPVINSNGNEFILHELWGKTARIW